MPDSLNDTIRGLVAAAAELENDAPSEAELAAIVARGEFRPDEDEAIGFWFARYLSIRDSLWAAIEEASERLGKPPEAIRQDRDLRYFLAGYAAACLLVRIDRLFLFRVADHSIIQRKLNEPFPEYRIPRKQYTRIFSAFVDEKSALAILDAMKFARKNRPAIMRLGTDPEVGFIVQQLDALESSLDPSKLSYLKGAWRFVSHKWRRRGVVSVQVTLAGLMEGLGRTASEFCETDNKNVDQNVLYSIAEFLQPGDVIVTRHAKALTNLFLPGFWPHASLYIGTPAQRKAAGIDAKDASERLQLDDICVLEARKDGVRLRPLDDTLAVDMFVVLRPNLEQESIRQAIDRAVLHEGKMYNFDFDFFNSDRIVCTEVVYRAYDGLENLRFPLQERAGRKTLSAEDLLDFALDAQAFEPVAIFGVKGCEREIVHGEDVRDLLEESYRR
ncbi:MAG: YiiX/YebB-like N1pC/P60 family cysteine hydrolase [Gammaproteobacteria bacterium]